LSFVSGIRFNASSEVRVHAANRHIVTFLSPLVEVAIVKFSRVNMILIYHTTHFRAIFGPLSRSKGKFGKPGIVVADGVPDRVEVGDTGLGRVRDVFEVASSISLGVSVTHLSSGVERLVYITRVVDDKT